VGGTTREDGNSRRNGREAFEMLVVKNGKFAPLAEPAAKKRGK